jgi:hypothetical protein
VAGEEGLVAGEVPAPGRRLAGLDREQLVDEQERRPVRQDVGRGGQQQISRPGT